MGGRQMEPVGILAYKKFTTHIITTNLYMHWRQGKWKLAFTLQKLQSKYSLKRSEEQRNLEVQECLSVRVSELSCPPAGMTFIYQILLWSRRMQFVHRELIAFGIYILTNTFHSKVIPC